MCSKFETLANLHRTYELQAVGRSLGSFSKCLQLKVVVAAACTFDIKAVQLEATRTRDGPQR